MTTESLERVHRYRQRKREGVRLVTLEINPAVIDELVRLRFLGEEQRQDSGAIGAAVAGLLSHVLQGISR